jgi:hypothetical protein
MWTKLNETMLKHDFPKLNFKGFIADKTQANWKSIKIMSRKLINNTLVYSIRLNRLIGTSKN